LGRTGRPRMAKRRKDGMAGVVQKSRWRESDARVVIEALERSGHELCLSRFARGLLGSPGIGAGTRVTGVRWLRPGSEAERI
jgi:hypothetical protein